MQFLTNPKFQTFLLILVLAFYAWSLGHDVQLIRRTRRSEIAQGKHHPELNFVKPSGVDIYGRRLPLLASSSKNTTRYIAFLLRADSVSKDVEFWSLVGEKLERNDKITLVGYCDGKTAAVLQNIQSHEFPILQYSDAVDIQTILNADAEGKAVVKDAAHSRSFNVSWRGSEETPAHVAQGLKP